MNSFRFYFSLCLLLMASLVQSQITFPKQGISNNKAAVYVFTNATIYKAYNQRLDNATLVVRNGKVEACGSGVRIPDEAVIFDLDGKYIYPTFIDLYSDYGLPKPTPIGTKPKLQPQTFSNKKGAFSWNEALKSDFNANEAFHPDEQQATELRSLGLGTVLSHRMDGISRGSGTLVHLGAGSAHEQILKNKASHLLSFSKGTSTQNNPNSIMGAIALLRQTNYDAQWYNSSGKNQETNLSLEAWNDLMQYPQVFVVSNKLDALRASKILKEFGKEGIIIGSGDEYQMLDEVKASNLKYVLPLNFPKAYDVQNPFDAMEVSLKQMMHWEMAESNAKRLKDAGVSIAFTFKGLKDRKELQAAFKRLLETGLTKADILEALTQSPATWLRVENEIGSLKTGSFANFFIADGDYFEHGTKILSAWIKGKPHELNVESIALNSGLYELKVGTNNFNTEIKKVSGKVRIRLILSDTQSVKVIHQLKNGSLNLSFQADKKKGFYRLNGSLDGTDWKGKGQTPEGKWVDWILIRRGAVKNNASPGTKLDPPKIRAAIPKPFVGYGWTKAPEKASLIFKNATIWTNEAEGILNERDVWIENGKIKAVGKDLTGANQVIDATGKHITCGIIDEHSHMAVSGGVNEGSQASSAEVRIGDAINHEDVNIYRQLAGGVTTSQLLHGSANPIGGQSALIKLRWGAAPETLKFKQADGFIKFALGENVKQSNWGDHYRTRFPQTRMGVEAVFIDHFNRAREYGELKYSGNPYRVDLEMEAILEVLEKKRFITCHSYRQSEINMLIKVAEEYSIRVNTFTHILEGYKLADKLKKHGAGGSSFSDWWAYKWEVMDAIPHNGAMMHEQGITVAYNSDDREMGRRLNQEAAKAIKYGGLSQAEAWKFVTLNPAKLLHIDHRVGSIKKGKDADIVLWSGNPLSMYSKAEMTFVDGIKYYDREEDNLKRNDIKKERTRLIQKMLKVKQAGGETQKVKPKKDKELKCDDLDW